MIDTPVTPPSIKWFGNKKNCNPVAVTAAPINTNIIRFMFSTLIHYSLIFVLITSIRDRFEI